MTGRHFTIGQLAADSGLSRSTLLYYDRLGLLRPSGRSPANYRLYSESDRERLRLIVTYRASGMSLDAIGELLAEDPEATGRTRLLTRQLDRLNRDIAALRRQQQIVVELLGSAVISRSTRSMSKQQWVGLLEAIGLGDEEMDEWHRQFELRMPEAHQDFLESLAIPVSEIRAIRQRSRNGAGSGG